MEVGSKIICSKSLETNVLDLIAEVASTIVYGHETWFTWRAERIPVHLLTHSNDFTRELQLISRDTTKN